MKKTNHHGRKKIARKLNKDEQVPLRPRRRGVMVNTILWSCLFVALMAFLLTQFTLVEGGPKDYAVGSIADTDIRAPRDIQYEDQEATRLKRLEAARSIKPVFDFDPSVSERFAQIHADIFNQARALIDEILVAQPPAAASGRHESAGRRAEARRGRSRERALIGGLTLEDAVNRFKPLFEPMKPETPDPSELEVMIRLRFAHVLEKGIIDSSKELFSAGYATDNYHEVTPSGGIVTRNLSTGMEREISAKTIALSKQEVRSRVQQWLASRLDAADEDIGAIASYMARVIRPNLFYNRNLTLLRKQEAQEAAGQILVKIPKGKIIVRYGDEITSEKLSALRALKKQGSKGRTNISVFVGTAIVLTLLVLVQWRFISEHPRFERIHRSCHVLTILITLISLFSAKVYFVLAAAIQETMPSVSWADPNTIKFGAPLAIGAMLVVLLLDVQVGYLFAILFSLLMGYLVDGDAFLMLYTFIGNIAAIYGLGMSTQKQRGALWKASAVVAVANCLVLLGHTLRTTPMPAYETVVGQLGFGLFGPLVLTFPIVYVAMYLLETIFGITTDIRLLELSNTNEPLLKQLQIQAPGTFHHSLMVANLAEPAAEAIDAHSLFVRVASLYHDVGKINKPEYFIENQESGVNRHEKLTTSMSSLVLISHVKDGLELAKEYKLPPGIRDAIRQHHGTRVIKYFYSKAKESARPDLGEVNESDYRYPGPKPQTREAAIIMLADALEAASRTLTDPSPTKLKGMIRKIVQDVFADEQLDECDLTLRELEKISNAFLRVLAAVHHQRIDYPSFRFESQEDFRRTKSIASTGKVLDWKQGHHKKVSD